MTVIGSCLTLLFLDLLMYLRLINSWFDHCKNSIVNDKFFEISLSDFSFELLCNWVTKGQSTLQGCACSYEFI